MNECSYLSIKIGDKESFTQTITNHHVNLFMKLSGDDNPLHLNEPFAIKAGFTGRVVYGYLTALFLSKLIGVYIPGKNSLILSQKTDFLKPVYINDVLTLSGVVSSKSDFGSIVTIVVNIHNQNGDKVLNGEIKVKMIK